MTQTHRELSLDVVNTQLTLRIDHLRELLEERQAAIDKALQLQSIEVHRRLELLNNEAERFRQMQATYLPRELYQQYHTELEKTVFNLEKTVLAQEVRGKVVTAFISAAVSLLVAFGNKLFH